VLEFRLNYQEISVTTSPRLPTLARFGSYEADFVSGELRKSGIRLKIQDRPFQILAILLEQPGQVVTREQLQKRLWAEDTFVDFEHGLNTAINKLRQVLSDEADNARFIETLPKRGYRFIAPVSGAINSLATAEPDIGAQARQQTEMETVTEGRSLQHAPAVAPPIPSKLHIPYFVAAVALVLAASIAFGGWNFFYRNHGESAWSQIRIAPLNGLPRESDATFSPDGNQVAFVWAGEKGGYAHIYISQIGAAGSPPRQLTNSGEGTFEFAPVWSPDGRYLAFFRFKENEKDLAIFVTAALGGSERRLYRVKSYRKVDALDWSPDGKFLAFSDGPSPESASQIQLLSLDTLEVHRVTSPPAGILGDFTPAFSPDGKSLAFVRDTLDVREIYLLPITGGAPSKSPSITPTFKASRGLPKATR